MRVLAAAVLVLACEGTIAAAPRHEEILPRSIPQPGSTVPVQVSGYVTGGGEVVVRWPGFECKLDIFSDSCPIAMVPADSELTVEFSPNLVWAGRGLIFYGVYTTSSNSTCKVSATAVRGPLSCTYWTGRGGSLGIYAPRCTDAMGWTSC